MVSTGDGAIGARDGGFAPGDVIHAVNGTDVHDVAQLRRAVEALRSGDGVVLQLERRAELMYLAFSIE